MYDTVVCNRDLTGIEVDVHKCYNIEIPESVYCLGDEAITCLVLSMIYGGNFLMEVTEFMVRKIGKRRAANNILNRVCHSDYDSILSKTRVISDTFGKHGGNVDVMASTTRGMITVRLMGV